MASARRLALALVLAAGSAAAAQEWVPAQPWANPRPESEWTVAFQTVLGGCWQWQGPGSRNGIAPEFDLLVIRKQVAVGPFLAAGGSDEQDGFWLGLAAGWSRRLNEWLRLDLLAEGGAHTITIESTYAYEASGSATFPFLGVRAGLHLTGDVAQNPALLFASRAGAGLQVAARTDLGRETVQPGSPPGAPPMAAVSVGGQILTLGLSVVLEW